MGYVVLFVSRYAGDGESLGVVHSVLAGRFSVAVDDVVYSSAVASVVDADVEQVLAEIVFFGDFLYPVSSVLADDDDFRHVRAVADEVALVFLEAHSYEAFLHIGVELGVVAYDLGSCNGLETSNFGTSREILAILGLDIAEEIDSVLRKVCKMFLYDVQFLLDFENLFVNDLRVEFGDLAYRLLHEFEDVLHLDFADKLTLELLHPRQNGIDLILPRFLVLLE